ncbi:DUF3265 domain-containing protein, partial [Vibrio vulnificus]|nr:DUF3265 domain-containing protein [Vibrio vulnificus]
AVGFGGESGLQKLGLCGTHPLTRRYKYMEVMWFEKKKSRNK